MASISTIPTSFPRRQPFFLPGTYYWTCPSEIYWAKITAIGGGGAGGYTSLGDGGGGGAGGFFYGIFKMCPNLTYTINVGYGGKQGIDAGTGLGHGTATTFGLTGGSLIGNTGYGTSPQNTNAQGAGGIVTCSQAQLIYNGGTGGLGSSTCNTYRAGGGGGGIGLSNGSNGVDGSTSIIAAGGSGAGSFGGNAGLSAYAGTTIAFSGGGGGIGYSGGNAITNTGSYAAGGGAGLFGSGVNYFGGPDSDGITANGANATTGKGGGGGGSKTNNTAGYLGSGILPTVNSPAFGIPGSAQLFFSIFNVVSGASGGSFVNVGSTGGVSGTDSVCGGGTGAVNAMATGTGFRGGNSWVCGGGGGAAGNLTTIGLNYALGGQGACGGGGGGGSVGGNGGFGLFMIEF